MDAAAFQNLIAMLTAEIVGRPLDAELDAYLNQMPEAEPAPSSR